MLRKANEHRNMQALVYGVILIWNLFWTLFKDRSLKKVGVVYWRTLSSTGVVTSVMCSGSRNSRIAASRIGTFINLPGKECQAGSGCLIQASCTVPWPAAFHNLAVAPLMCRFYRQPNST
jgi:hypothetical protein